MARKDGGRHLTALLVHLVMLAPPSIAQLMPASAADNAGFTPEQKLANSLGLRRRADRIFDEFIESRVRGDGYGLRRGWRSRGACPERLTITDNAGQISYADRPSERGTAVARERTCTWRLRPGFFLGDGGYIVDVQGPITLTFTQLSLSPYETHRAQQRESACTRPLHARVLSSLTVWRRCAFLCAW